MSGPQLRVGPPTVGAAIAGLGVYRPPRVVTNEEICRYIDSSDEWIRERSGVIERRFSDVPVVEMAIQAAQAALDDAGFSADQVDLVVVATISHMVQTPAAAPMVAAALGATNAAGFDLGAACSGFSHALAVADAAIRAGTARIALVIGADKMTDLIDIRDRSSSFIFADGAGALVLTASEEAGIGPVVWGSDGSRSELIAQDRPWTDLRADDGSGQAIEHWPTMKMTGPAVFRWAVWGMAPIAEQAIAAAGITADDLVAFIPHQANIRITDALVKQLKLPEHVAVSRDIVNTGNTTGGSIPLAMHGLLSQRPELAGGLALLIGFGAGLAYAAQVVRLPDPPREAQTRTQTPDQQ